MGIGSLSWNVSYALHTLTEKRILDYPENSRPTKTILDWPENFRTTKRILDRQKNSQLPRKFLTDKKYSRPARSSRPTEKILDPREEILQDRYEFSNGGFASRLMEGHLGLLSLKLDLKNNLDHFYPLWLSIVLKVKELSQFEVAAK